MKVTRFSPNRDLIVVPGHVLGPRGREQSLRFAVDTGAGQTIISPELTATGLFGGFGGTCLYARRDSDWACYTIKPNAARSIGDAEAWLVKRDLEDWG